MHEIGVEISDMLMNSVRFLRRINTHFMLKFLRVDSKNCVPSDLKAAV